MASSDGLLSKDPFHHEIPPPWQKISRFGVFAGRDGKAFRHLLDGTSNIAMIGERRWRYKREDNGQIATTGAGVVFGVRNPGFPGTRDVLGIGVAKLSYSWVKATIAQLGFSSQHPGGAEFALADGSVRQ